MHAIEEILSPKVEEPQIHVDQPHVEVPRVETSTQAESFKDGRKRSREADRLLEDVRENVGTPSSQRRQRRSPERYTGYMALAGECVETEPSSFEEAVQQPIWVDAMVEEYDSIVQNSVWDVVPRPENKSVVSSRWLYKVKKAANDGRIMLLHFISKEEQDVDILTKAFPRGKFEFHRCKIGVVDNPFLVEREC